MLVVIPTLNLNHLNNFFSDLDNTDLTHVTRFLIFNNSMQSWNSPHEKIQVYNLGRNTGVNYSWNRGLQIADFTEDDLMLINDDIVFKPGFFTKTQEVIDKFPQYNVFCPITTNSYFEFEKHFFTSEKRYVRMKKRAGWAFTIRYKALRFIKPIPKELFLFFGDDWIWSFTGGMWLMDQANMIYHEVGKTMKTNPELRKMLNQERQIYSRHMEILGRKYEDSEEI